MEDYAKNDVYGLSSYPLYSINLYMTMAINMATRAKYHEAMNIMEIQRQTPMKDKDLEINFHCFFSEWKIV